MHTTHNGRLRPSLASVSLCVWAVHAGRQLGARGGRVRRALPRLPALHRREREPAVARVLLVQRVQALAAEARRAGLAHLRGPCLTLSLKRSPLLSRIALEDRSAGLRGIAGAREAVTAVNKSAY